MMLNLHAVSLVDLYRLNGIEAVEEKLQQSLARKDYWDEFLKDKNVDFGYYETKKYIIVTQKGQKELALYKKDKNNFSLVQKNSVIVGEIEGDKYLEGDKKTPEGAYDLTEKKTGLDQFYGPFALETSYPNTFDKTLDKKGHGIWIHGMPLNEDRELYTRGCIALDNPELEELDKKIDLEKSILLTSNGELKKASKDEIALVLSSIFKWTDAWKRSDIEEYLNYYSEDFKKYDGTDINKFSKYKKRIFNKKEKKKIRFSNIDISPYPNSLNKNMFRVVMDQEYKSPSITYIGKKELYLELIDNQVKILAEG